MVARAYQSTLVDRANGVPIATARGGNIIGGGDWSENRIVPDFIRAHYKGSSLAIRSPSAVRPWQHVIALCHGYLCLAESLLRHGTDFAQGYNFGPADNDITTVAELVECLSSHWPGVKLEYEKGTFAETHLLSVNSAKARSELGWNPPIDFKQTAAWTADWYKNVHDDPGCALKITLDQIKEYRKGLSS
jgi:CDP-glucose 4,6-dehydratase